jgi:hypothetical protein
VIRALLKNNQSTSGYALGAYFESDASGSGSASSGAIDAKATRADGGTITNLTGLNLEAGHLSGASGTSTNAYGIKILMRRSAGTITNSYGLHLSDSGAATNNFGIYQASSTQTNVFNGNIKVGSTTVNAGDERFEINGNIAPTTNNSGSVGLSSKRFSAMYTGTLNATGNISSDSDVVAGSVLPKQDNTGSVGNGTLLWNAIYSTNNVIQTSDGRLKTDIRDSELGLDFILGLRPVSYEWKNRSELGEGTHYGLIAQELEKNLKGRKFAGLVHDDKTDRYSVIYTELIAPLIKAVQELYQKITGHDARLATLEAENARLKAESQAQADLLKDLASRVQKLEGRAPASSARKPASK